MKLLRLLLEAPLDDKTAEKMISSGKQVSIYYQGDDDTPKGWKKIEPIKVEDIGGENYLTAFEIEGLGKKPVRKSYKQKKITNWNMLSTAVASTAAKEKEKEDKEKKKKATAAGAPKVRQRKLSGIDEKISDAVVNKRVVKLYYQGDEEEAPGWRTNVEPVCFGSRKGVKYVRAWQEDGKTTTTVPAWKFFRVDRIKNWEADSTKTFNAPPDPRFNPKGDKHLDTIFAIADFTPGAAPAALQEGSILSAIKEAINIF